MGWLDDVKSKGLPVSLAVPDGHLDLSKASVVHVGFSQRVALYAQILTLAGRARATGWPPPAATVRRDPTRPYGVPPQ